MATNSGTAMGLELDSLLKGRTGANVGETEK